MYLSQEYERIADGETDALLVQASQQYEQEVVDKRGNDDDGIDSLLLEASQQYEQEVHDETDGAGRVDDVVTVDDVLDDVLLEASKQHEAVQATRFGMLVTNKVLENVRKSVVPEKTQQSTRWEVIAYSVRRVLVSIYLSDFHDKLWEPEAH